MRFVEEIMGMPVIVDIVGDDGEKAQKVFDYFRKVDDTFSTYKEGSEISKLNREEIMVECCSGAVQEILKLAEETKQETNGYFDVKKPDGSLDPSGLVKGWAINNASSLLRKLGETNFYVEAGGDIQTSGTNQRGGAWRIGIQHPFDKKRIVKVIQAGGRGVATSGTIARGAHIYNPHTAAAVHSPFVSITVIGPNVYEADRFATAAFAMGEAGVHFLESQSGFEAYAIDTAGIATQTSGLGRFVCSS